VIGAVDFRKSGAQKKRPAGFPTGLMIMVGHQHSRPNVLAQGEPDL
jgi:hypothetical protein